MYDWGNCFNTSFCSKVTVHLDYMILDELTNLLSLGFCLSLYQNDYPFLKEEIINKDSYTL